MAHRMRVRKIGSCRRTIARDLMPSARPDGICLMGSTLVRGRALLISNIMKKNLIPQLGPSRVLLLAPIIGSKPLPRQAEIVEIGEIQAARLASAKYHA